MNAVPQAPERPTNIAALRSSTLFNSLTGEDLDELATVSHMAYAERGETIWMRGSEVDFYGLVGVGFVKMVQSLPNGHEVTSEIMGPGQIFGLLGAIEGAGCPLASRAVCNMWYLKIPKADFMPIYDGRVEFKDQLLRRTTNRLRQTMDVMAKMSTGRVDERIALILMLLSESYGRKGLEGIEIQVPLTRQDVAEMAGTTVESTIRTMSRWQKQGIIRSDHMIVTILDDDALFARLKS